MRAVIFDLDHTIFTTENILHDGTKELLAILHRLGLAIGGLSNDDHRVLVRLEEAGIRDYFSSVLCADQAVAPKEVSGVERMLHSLEVNAQESALVSHAHSDILLGKDASLGRTIAVTHGQLANVSLDEAHADRQVAHIPAVLDVLE